MLDSFLNSFEFNFYALPVLIISILTPIVGSYIYAQNRKSPVNQSFFLLCIAILFWHLGQVGVYCAKDPVFAITIYRRVAFLGVVLISPCVYLFSTLWLGLYEKKKKIAQFGFVWAAFFYVLGLFADRSFPGVREYYWGYYPIYGPFNIIFLAFFFTYFLSAFYNFIAAYRARTQSRQMIQIKLIAIGFLVSFLSSLDYVPKIINWAFYPLGFLYVFFWISVIAYTIIKYKALDIETVIHKTFMWLLASSVLGGPLVAFFYIQKEFVYQLPAPIYLTVLIFSFIIVVLYTRHVQPKIDHLFQRRQWDLSQAMERFNDGLVDMKGLEELVSYILASVKNTFYASNVSLFVLNEKKGEYDFFEGTSKAVKVELSSKASVTKWLEENDSIISKDYLSLDPRLKEIESDGQKYFEETQALFGVPMVVNQRLLGILNVGQKENLRRFTSSEINFFQEFRRSAGIALSNALHLIAMQENLKRWNEELEKKVQERTEQLEDTQAQLVQAEKMATIGTLAGGVAHEINNPLTAVLTNAQILKMGANPDDIESLDLIEEGAKRCQVIIQNLLKYARKSQVEELRSEVDLHEMIKSVCSLLEYQLKQDNVKVDLDFEKVPLIKGVANELEQVLTNLLVNARDAIKATGKPGTIFIKSYEKEKRAYIEVRDQGVGMSKEVMKKIFDPFYTTKDVGGGTGLGLAVSYSIIEKFEGQVSVDSEEGVGTTFRLHFPVPG